MSMGLFFQDTFHKGCDLERCWEMQDIMWGEMFVGLVYLLVKVSDVFLI